ncbi:MAG TPA: hypothetical protein VKK79_24455, partial [Candidatus Lokiarchaeia archaeon]|nr:hypothetical protein [Candidatus Lokiarchaeia archaeon]
VTNTSKSFSPPDVEGERSLKGQLPVKGLTPSKHIRTYPRQKFLDMTYALMRTLFSQSALKVFTMRAFNAKNDSPAFPGCAWQIQVRAFYLGDQPWGEVTWFSMKCFASGRQ